MPNIQVLCHQFLSEEDQKEFEESKPHICTEDPNSFLIATPHTSGIPDAELYNHTGKIWELEAKVRTYEGDFEPLSHMPEGNNECPICPICSGTFSLFAKLKKHMLSAHNLKAEIKY